MERTPSIESLNLSICSRYHNDTEVSHLNTRLRLTAEEVIKVLTIGKNLKDLVLYGLEVVRDKSVMDCIADNCQYLTHLDISYTKLEYHTCDAIARVRVAAFVVY